METKVKNLMSADLVTIGESEPIALADERMRSFNIRHLPVKNEHGQVVGILSDRDVQRAMRSKVKRDRGLKVETTDFDTAARVSDYMSWPVRAFDADSALRPVIELMIEEKLSSVLVTEQGRTIGIVTTEDLLKAMLRLLDYGNGEPSLKALLPRELWISG